MTTSLRIAVVVPALDERERIGRVVTNVPDWVEHVIVVDDGSADGTEAAAHQTRDPRLSVVRHTETRGVGAAIVTGYRRALELDADVLVVMAGDGQMDPDDLPALLEPIRRGEADYVKGNRFLHSARRTMPLARRVAGKVLARATRAATGYVVDDSQCGYTALTARAASRVPLESLWPRYGYPNDLLALLSRGGFRVAEVPVRPVYAGERSGVRPWHAAVILALLSWRVLEQRSVIVRLRRPEPPSPWTSGERAKGRNIFRSRLARAAR